MRRTPPIRTLGALFLSAAVVFACKPKREDIAEARAGLQGANAPAFALSR